MIRNIITSQENSDPDQEIEILPTYDGATGLLRQEGNGYAR